jgi:hypothetical protein
MSFEIIIENNSKIFTKEGSKTLYEETYDGTHSGWYKFQKDIASEVGIKDEHWKLYIKKDNDYILVDDANTFNELLENSINQGKMYVKIENTFKETKKKGTKDIEKGEHYPEHTNKGEHRNSSLICKCIKIPILIIISIPLIILWILGIVVSFFIELFWLPFKICCPCACLCICCAEEIQKEIFGLFFYILKMPFRFIKWFLE